MIYNIFEIIAIHDSSVDSFAELDEKLVAIKENYWKGESLPFPILIDKDGATEAAFGVVAGKAWAPSPACGRGLG